MRGRFRNEHRNLAKLISEDASGPHSFSFFSPWKREVGRPILPQSFEGISELHPVEYSGEYRDALAQIEFHGTCVFQRQVDGAPCGIAQRINDLCIFIANEFDINHITRNFRPQKKLLIFYRGDEMPPKARSFLTSRRPIALKLGEQYICLGPKAGGKLLAFALMNKRGYRGIEEGADALITESGKEFLNLEVFEGDEGVRKQIQNLVSQLPDSLERVGNLEVRKNWTESGLFLQENGVYSLNLDVDSIVIPEIPGSLICPELAEKMKEKGVTSQYGLPERGRNQYEQLEKFLGKIYREIA